MVRLLALVFLLSSNSQSGAPPSAAPRPVEEITKPRAASEVSLGSFEFQEVTFLHGGPGFFRIDGKPAKGTRYPVEASIYGVESVASVRFELVDARGASIERIKMARIGTPRSSRFVGMVTVPAQPFRAVITGVASDGTPFRSADDRLFNPADHATPPRTIPGLAPEEARLLEEMMRDARPRLTSELEAELERTSGDTIEVPRMKVANVTYEPLLSAHSRVIGLRIRYDVTFSARAAYDPEIAVLAKYGDNQSSMTSRMHVINSSITPLPRQAYPPHEPFSPSELVETPLESGATFIYEAKTTYRFVADLVPDFVIYNLGKTRTCVFYERFRYSPQERKTFEEMLASDAQVPYAVFIGGASSFEGRIPRFAGFGTLHGAFAAEGAADCGPQPTRRF